MNKESDSIVSEEDIKPSEALYPQHERGLLPWMVVLCCFLAMVGSYGIINAYGVFSEHYSNAVYPTAHSAIIGMVGALQVASLNLAAPLSARLAERFGYTTIVAAGGLTMAAGMIVASFASSIGVVLVFQGIVTGLGASPVVTLATTVPSQWFTRKRGLAIGIAYSGAGFGGAAFSPVLRTLISTVGIAWATRISGIIVGLLICLSALGIRRQSHQLAIPTRSVNMYDFGQLRDTRVVLFCAYSVLFYGNVFIPFFYLPLFATRNGHSATDGSTLVLLGTMCSGVGRILGGFVSDRIGKLNTLILSISLAFVSTLVLWLPFKAIGTAAVYSMLYGLASGSQFALLSVTVAQAFGVERHQCMMGLVMAFGAVGVLPGTPGAGLLLDGLGHGTNFTQLIVYFAIVLALQLVSPIYLRLDLSKKALDRV